MGKYSAPPLLGAMALTLLFGVAAWAAECPPGATPSEDIATGKVSCRRGDTLDSRSPNAAPGYAPGRPGKPGSPATPASPGVARSPESLEPAASGEGCGLSRWGCEEACQKTYLISAQGSSGDAPQRAKVALGQCLRACARRFACEPRALEPGHE